MGMSRFNYRMVGKLPDFGEMISGFIDMVLKFFDSIFENKYLLIGFIVFIVVMIFILFFT